MNITHTPSTGSLAKLGLALLSLTLASAASAQVVLTFEGLKDLEFVGNFYNGGTGSLGSSGTNYGISFGSSALSVIDFDAGGSGNIGGEPSGETALFFLTGTAVMNVPAGFDTGFSFYYSAVNRPGYVKVWSGENVTGTLLATLTLPRTQFAGAPDPNGDYSPFFAFGVNFSGIAKSVDFGGTINQIAFDNITLGASTPINGLGSSMTPVPEPSTYGLCGAVLVAGLGAWRKRRKSTVS